MSATIRYVNGDVKSTVVILKDGRAMEVRRGETTDWSAPGPGSARLVWSSMAAWAAQLGPWPSVEAWRASRAPLGSYPESKPVTISPYLARFLGRADGVSREEVRDALNSYVAARWGLSVYRTKRDVKPAVKEYRLDDFLVTLTGLHPDGLYTARQILNAVLTSQVLTVQVLTVQVVASPEPEAKDTKGAEVDLEVSECEEALPTETEPASAPASAPATASAPAAAPVDPRDLYISQLQVEVLRLRLLIQSAGLTLLNSVSSL